MRPEDKGKEELEDGDKSVESAAASVRISHSNSGNSPALFFSANSNVLRTGPTKRVEGFDSQNFVEPSTRFAPFDPHKFPKDLLAFLFTYLSFQDWVSVTKVSKRWYVNAHRPHVKKAAARTLLPVLIRKFQENIKRLREFINPEELIGFLCNTEVPLAVKIKTINDLKSEIGTSLHRPFYHKHFKNTLSMQILKDDEGKALIPLFETLDTLNVALIRAFRFPLESERVVSQFNQEIYDDYQTENRVNEINIATINPENADPEIPPNFASELPENLQLLLKAKNSGDFTIDIKNFDNLASQTRRRYLHQYGRRADPCCNRFARYAIIIGGILTTLLAPGIYFLDMGMTDFSTWPPIQAPGWYDDVGIPLTVIGGVAAAMVLIVLSWRFHGYFMDAYFAARVLNNNLAQNPRVEVLQDQEPAPTETTHLLPKEPDIEAPADPGSAYELNTDNEGLFNEERTRYGINNG